MNDPLVGFPDDPPGAVLSDQEIRRLVQECGLITEFQEGALQGASYDLSLGRECFTRGEHRMLTFEVPSYAVQPGQFILVTSRERLRLPDDVVGHAGLISRWAQRGLISLFSPQIDPGFVGLVVVPLFNAGHAPVTLKYGETMFTVEFVRTTQCTSTPWARSHAPLDGIPAAVEVKMASPDLSDVTGRLDALEASVATLAASVAGYQTGTAQRYSVSATKAGWFAVVLAVLAVLVTVVLWLIDAI